MDLGNLANKAKDAVKGNSEKIKEQADKQIDKHLDGDKAKKAKDAVDSGLDKLGANKAKDDAKKGDDAKAEDKKEDK